MFDKSSYLHYLYYSESKHKISGSSADYSYVQWELYQVPNTVPSLIREDAIRTRWTLHVQKRFDTPGGAKNHESYNWATLCSPPSERGEHLLPLVL